MKRIAERSVRSLLLLSVVVLALAACSGRAGVSSRFVSRVGSELRLEGKPFRFGGANNYYLMYKSPTMVDNLLTSAATHHLRVLRMWGSLDIGNQDGSNSIHGKADGVYFQYWIGSEPAYNDGDDGLKRLDYVVHKADQLGIKLVIPFVNNWEAFGGMDQYVRWRGGKYHDDFYTDATIRTWYKNWIAHRLNRTNSYNGVAYKDDPTIMTWELANEPRCKGTAAYPTSGSCTAETITAWADDITVSANKRWVKLPAGVGPRVAANTAPSRR
jgi:mannan endo-1,4-beta-mannosidase